LIARLSRVEFARVDEFLLLARRFPEGMIARRNRQTKLKTGLNFGFSPPHLPEKISMRFLFIVILLVICEHREGRRNGFV
jgi:hypothetical protein